MSSKYVWLILRQLRKIWVRAVALALLAFATVVLSPAATGFIPSGWAGQIGEGAVEQMLSILSSSMLAVTTFSLSIAVSAFAAAASSATPRATALLQEDPTTQNVLATFLGAFLFGLVGMIALKAGYYSPEGLFILFVAAVAVIGFVVVALLRWISHLMSFGRIEDTLDRVEEATCAALARRHDNPCLGGAPQHSEPPHGVQHITSPVTGYIQHIDMEALSEIAERVEARIWIVAVPGSFVHIGAPFIAVECDRPLSEEDQTEVRTAFSFGRNRSFDQDPRFGLVVLAEIASRALSPSVNDPGTAIDVLGRLVRVLSPWRAPEAQTPQYPDILVPRLEVSEMLEHAFRPIARDGAHLVEVQIRLQKACSALKAIDPATFTKAAEAAARDAMARVELNDSDMAHLREVACVPS